MKNLLQHQIEDAAFLASRKFAGCFSGMGSGKTLTAIEATRRVDAQNVLVIAPPIALHMWAQEFETETGLSAQILRSGSTKIRPEQSASQGRVLVCSYSIATSRREELRSFLSDARSVLICDESHALKSDKAKRTKAVLGSCGIASGADYAWMLTGTPVTRWNDDLFPFLCRADMAGLKQRTGGASKDRFNLRYTIQQQRRFGNMRRAQPITVGNRNTDELNEWLYHGDNRIAVRRELKDVWDAMPPLTFNTYMIDAEATPEYLEAKAALGKRSVAQVADALQSGEEPALATMRRVIGLAKVKAASDYLAERASDTQGAILVGAWHTQVIDSLVDRLKDHKLRVASLDGRTSAARKAQLQADFNEGRLDVLVGQISAMGVSLNLQRGGNCIVTVEEDWSPAVMDQFYARLHRMGQDKHVHVDRLMLDNPLDQAVAKLSARKSAEHKRLNQQEDAA